MPLLCRWTISFFQTSVVPLATNPPRHSLPLLCLLWGTGSLWVGEMKRSADSERLFFPPDRQRSGLSPCQRYHSSATGHVLQIARWVSGWWVSAAWLHCACISHSTSPNHLPPPRLESRSAGLRVPTSSKIVQMSMLMEVKDDGRFPRLAKRWHNKNRWRPPLSVGQLWYLYFGLGMNMQAVTNGFGFLLVQLHDKRRETGQISASLSLKLRICNSIWLSVRKPRQTHGNEVEEISVADAKAGAWWSQLERNIFNGHSRQNVLPHSLCLGSRDGVNYWEIFPKISSGVLLWKIFISAL